MVDNRGPRPGQSPGDDTPWPDPFIAAGVPDPEAERRAGMGRRRVSPFVPLAGGCLIIVAAFLAVWAMIVGVAGSVAHGWDDDRHNSRELVGSGVVTTKNVPARGVREVNFDGHGTLILTQGSDETLTIEAEDNILSRIETDIDGDELTIGYQRHQGSTTRPTKPVIYRLTLRTVEKVALSDAAKLETAGLKTDRLTLELRGAGEATLDGLTADRLKVTMNGAGKVRTSGMVDHQEIVINGAGAFHAPDLGSREATVNVNGAGEVIVQVSDDLDVKISGAGNVEYYGKPTVDPDISGMGRVHQAGASRPQPLASPQAPTPPQPPASPQAPAPPPTPVLPRP